MTEYLYLQDITDNVAIIKINQLYRKNMTPLELYETTRGIWKRKLESVQDAEYGLAVVYGIVVEAYTIDQWYPAGTIPMETRVLDPKRCIGRIEFTGETAPEFVRQKYIGKSVAPLFKWGEASPVKIILRNDM